MTALTPTVLPPPNPELDLTAEFDRLQARKTKLLELIRLRNEVLLLEQKAMGANAIVEAARVEDAMRLVCLRFGVTTRDLKSQRRDNHRATARQVFCYLCHQTTGMSDTRIGRLLGDRDHSTISYADRAVKTRMSVDTTFAKTVEELLAELIKP